MGPKQSSSRLQQRIIIQFVGKERASSRSANDDPRLESFPSELLDLIKMNTQLLYDY